MTFDEYQKEAHKTALYPGKGRDFWYTTLGLVGESGEVSEKIKKLFRDDDGILTSTRREELLKELGDVLWYLAELSNECGFSFNQVAETNIEKLKSRKKREKIIGDGDNR